MVLLDPAEYPAALWRSSLSFRQFDAYRLSVDKRVGDFLVGRR